MWKPWLGWRIRFNVRPLNNQPQRLPQACQEKLVGSQKVSISLRHWATKRMCFDLWFEVTFHSPCNFFLYEEKAQKEASKSRSTLRNTSPQRCLSSGVRANTADTFLYVDTHAGRRAARPAGRPAGRQARRHAGAHYHLFFVFSASSLATT